MVRGSPWAYDSPAQRNGNRVVSDWRRGGRLSDRNGRGRLTVTPWVAQTARHLLVPPRGGSKGRLSYGPLGREKTKKEIEHENSRTSGDEKKDTMRNSRLDQSIAGGVFRQLMKKKLGVLGVEGGGV